MKHHSRDVGGFSERGVADHVDVGKSSYAQGVAQAGPARAFQIEEKFQIFSDTETRIQGLDARGCVFRVGAQAVRPTVFRVERRLLLADEIGLDREPVTVVAPIGVVRLTRSGLSRVGLSKKECRGKEHPENQTAQQFSMVQVTARRCQCADGTDMEYYPICN